jgi:hypothetical protein
LNSQRQRPETQDKTLKSFRFLRNVAVVAVGDKAKAVRRYVDQLPALAHSTVRV